MTFKFPANDYDDPNLLLSQLGSHWRQFYGGRELVRRLLQAYAENETQTLLNYQELVACLSRQSVPVYHRQRWFALQVLESGLTDHVLRYGDGAVYGPNPPDNFNYQYGTTSRARLPSLLLPEGLQRVPVITDGVTSPATVWTYGQDYRIEGRRLVLANNPFDDGRFHIESVFDDTGTQTDRVATLWLFGSLWDSRWIADKFGYTVGTSEDSSSEYRDLVNAAWDALTQGSAHSHVLTVLSAIFDGPICKTDGEVVELVTYHGDRLWIATDKAVYSAPGDATATVAAGDTLQQGDSLTDVLTFLDLTSGQRPAELDRLHIPADMTAGGLYSGLTFWSTPVPLQVTTDDNGVTRVAFELGGDPDDVTAFWDEVHRRGTLPGQTTLARLLDVRGPDAVTEPTAASLPATIVPADFLVENLARFNLATFKIKVFDSPRQLDSGLVRLLRRVVPPWNAAVLIFELQIQDDTMSPEAAGTTTDPGTSEEAEAMLAGDCEDDLDPAIIAESCIAYLSREACS
jgi:hypothetical protein